MWQFIVSGYIPGTDIQVTFDMFASLAGLFACVALVGILIRYRSSFRHDMQNAIAKLERIREISL